MAGKSKRKGKVLKIEGGRWETAIGRAVRKPKPPGGWPKAPKRKKPPP